MIIQASRVLAFFSILMSMLMVTAAANAQSAPSNDELPSGELEGAFSSWGKTSLSGSWSVVSENGRHYIQLADNFSAKKGPDVKIFLSPTASADVTGDNATKGSVFVKLLDDFSGRARIELPNGVDLSDYQSLIFHCEEYSKLWGVSALR